MGSPARSNLVKSKSKKSNTKNGKELRKMRVSLEDAHRSLFVSVLPGGGPIRDRLSIYKSVPSVTTYGLYERP